MRKSQLLAVLVAMTAVAAFGQDQDPPSRVARLNYISGTVSFRPSTVEEWTAATLNYPLYHGDHLWADRDARSELHVGSTALRMGPETSLAILSLDDRMVQLSLTGGTLEVRLSNLGDGESFEVDTPNAAVTLLRAGEYRFSVDGDRLLTTVAVRGGDAEVTGGGRAFTLHARESARLSGADHSFSSQLDSAPPPDAFEAWCRERDRREEQSESVRHVSRETIGYEDLDANGVWSEIPDCGWVWAPRVNAGWAPYRDGHWAWVEPWGWTWVDDAPWGFAPFHYGRWANLRGAWFWVPGTMAARPVYAPALVAFVGVPRVGVSLSIGAGVAWFPLGPHEVYRPAYRVSEVYVREVNITHVSVTNINVTNVRYVNQNAGAVTMVSRETFVGARPVRAAQVSVSAEVVQGRVVGSTAAIAPEHSSVMGRPQGMVAAPGSRFEARAVVVRHAPPPPPVSFAARREALQANPGRPLDPAAAEALRRTQSPRTPAYRQATQPAAATVPGARTDRPRMQEQQAAPRAPAPETRGEQPSQRAQPQAASQARGEARSEARQQAKQEKKKGSTKKEERKDERKQ
jgi:hypothetical protein